MDLGNVVEGLPDGIDLEAENLNGMFTNLTVLQLLLLSLTKDRSFPKTKLTFKSEYDYIIVGGGSAGSVLANRLSEEECVTILVLEAGGEAPYISEVPAYARLLYGSNIDWHYKTEPQKNCAFGQNENRLIWNSGKALGGSSVLNAMLYVRGNMKNYDDWESEGATGWGYKDVFPYFLKLEDNRNIDELDPGFHRTGGPMTVEKPNYTPEIKDPILEATKAMGYDLTDINGRRQTGMYDLQGTLRNGQRCSTAKAYLVPAEDRPNLDIVKDAFVTKILIQDSQTGDDSRPNAYGVEFQYLGLKQTVRARKEVIVSTGSIRAPQLLMLSGIGPREHLESFGIPVVSDLPVGKNLQDHYAAASVYEMDPTIQQIVVKLLNPLNVGEYTISRSGPLTAPNQCTVLAFLDGLNTTNTSPDFPMQELYFAEYSVSDALINSNMKPEVYAQAYGGLESSPVYICIASLLQPYSRGEIRLNSLDPFEQPTIDPKYYDDERDLHDVVEGLKICDAVANRPEMQKVQSKPLDRAFPGCEQFEDNDDDYFTCLARQFTLTFWHSAGTTRMGQPDDPRSVVDPELRVIGVDGLRVVCAAIMPIVPSGNTNIPTIMVAEKAADIIKLGITCTSNQGGSGSNLGNILGRKLI